MKNPRPKHSTSIQKIDFTDRQFDVLAAFIHLKKPQSIATLLGISNKGVEAHIYNIKQKLPLKRKDHFLDTCSHEEKKRLQAHYQYLLIENAFQGLLKDLKSHPMTYRWKEEDETLISATTHLKMAGLLHQEEGSLILDPSSLSTSTDYYAALIEILKPLFPLKGPLFDAFLTQQKSILSNKPPHKIRFLKYGILLLLTALSFFFIKRSDPPERLTSDLTIPHESFLLHREEKVQALDYHLKKPFSRVILIGPEGSGKTTLARYYGRLQKTVPIVWEVNAESKSTILRSFFDLAYALAKTKREEVSLIDQSSHREQQIILFLKNHLKNYPSWFLIFDNLEDPLLLRDFAPNSDWGNGTLLITSKNLNLKYSNHVNIQDVLILPCLTRSEMQALFIKLLYAKETFSTKIRAELDILLEGIPPFPLDVSLASAYIKLTHVSPSKYVNYLTNQKLESLFEILLKEGGSYSKTRLYIITRSVKKILSDTPAFLDHLLLTCLLNSQGIPKDLVGQSLLFTKALQQYSLITAEEKTMSLHRTTQSIMLSSLIKIVGYSKIKALIPSIIKTFTDYVDRLIDLEDLPPLQNMICHIETLLTHEDLLTTDLQYKLQSKLGNIYYYAQTGSYEYAKSLLQMNLKNESINPIDALSDAIYMGRIYVQLDEKEPLRRLLTIINQKYKKYLAAKTDHTAWALSFMGDMYTILGDYQKAKDVLITSAAIYQENHNDIGLARALAYLGNVYLNLGDYRKATHVLGNSLGLYRRTYPRDHYRLGWILQILGRANLGMHNYEKAIYEIESGLSIYEQYFDESKILVAWASFFLCDTYINCGLYEKARVLLEKRMAVSLSHYQPNHHICALEHFLYGKLLLKTGHIETAEKALNKSLEIFKSILPDDHVDRALLETSFGEFLMLKKDYKEAEALLTKALSILEQKRKPEMYRPLEVLLRLYWQRSIEERDPSLKQKSFSLYHQILKHFEEHFPHDQFYIHKLKVFVS